MTTSTMAIAGCSNALSLLMGMRDAESERRLAAAFDNGDWEQTSRRAALEPMILAEAQCWLRAPGWCLAYE